MTRASWLLMATHVPASGSGGGMVRYVVEMARALAVHPRVDLHVLADPSARPLFTGLGVAPDRLHDAPRGPVLVRSLLERAGAGALREPFDVVHGTKHLLPGRSRARRRVLTVHDMLPLDRPQDFGLVKRSLVRAPYLRSVADSDVLVCVSEATRDRLRAYAPAAAPRAAVVRLAVSGALLTASPVPVPALVGRSFALVVGDSSARKNLPLVVDAWPDVVARVPGATLALVGPPGWGRARLASTPGLLERGDVVLAGHLGEGELRWAYEHAAVVLCPSALEGFGLPAVEAAAFGAPLLTSDDPALCEVSPAGTPHLPSDDPAAWVDAVTRTLRAPGGTGAARAPAGRGTAHQVRSWHDVAQETVEVVLGAR